MKPTFDSFRAATLSNSVSYRRKQLASDPGNALLALWLRQAEKELSEELALQDSALEDISDLEDMSDADLLAALLA